MRIIEVDLNRSVDRLLDALSEGRADPGNVGEIGLGGVPHPLHRPEFPEQGALLGRPDALDLVEDRLDRPLAAELLVVRDREPVGLVADALHEEEALRARRKEDRLRPAGYEQLLALLGQR